MNQYVQLAQRAVEKYISENKILEVPANLPTDFFSRQAGVFVTIFNQDELRGCIGTYLPTRKNIAKEIIHNAMAACSEDYRFDPITVSELPALRYEVSILSEPCSVQDMKKHDPKKEGIIVRSTDGRTGLLLPDLEGVDTTEEQIAIACQKGGINPRRDPLQFFEFTVEKRG
jgi:AmmeMemoRadiSam system protein A